MGFTICQHHKQNFVISPLKKSFEALYRFLRICFQRAILWLFCDLFRRTAFLTSVNVVPGLNKAVFDGIITSPVAFRFVSRRRLQAKIEDAGANMA
jgi:hypothetical protein